MELGGSAEAFLRGVENHRGKLMSFEGYVP